jgi:hypothetical protein
MSPSRVATLLNTVARDDLWRSVLDTEPAAPAAPVIDVAREPMLHLDREPMFDPVLDLAPTLGGSIGAPALDGVMR